MVCRMILLPFLCWAWPFFFIHLFALLLSAMIFFFVLSIRLLFRLFCLVKHHRLLWCDNWSILVKELNWCCRCIVILLHCYMWGWRRRLVVKGSWRCCIFFNSRFFIFSSFRGFLFELILMRNCIVRELCGKERITRVLGRVLQLMWIFVYLVWE
jgi:hypothetical protein